MKELRCLKCGRLQAKADNGLLGGIEFKCPKCGSVVYFLITPDDILVSLRKTVDKSVEKLKTVV